MHVVWTAIVPPRAELGLRWGERATTSAIAFGIGAAGFACPTVGVLNGENLPEAVAGTSLGSGFQMVDLVGAIAAASVLAILTLFISGRPGDGDELAQAVQVESA